MWSGTELRMCYSENYQNMSDRDPLYRANCTGLLYYPTVTDLPEYRNNLPSLLKDKYKQSNAILWVK